MHAIRRGFTVLTCLVMLSACQEDGPAISTDGTPVPDLLQAARQQCDRDGGRWALAPGKVTYVCYKELRDAGKLCRASSDCEGICLARSRTCSPIEPFYGCHEVLTNGGGQQTLCVE